MEVWKFALGFIGGDSFGKSLNFGLIIDLVFGHVFIEGLLVLQRFNSS